MRFLIAVFRARTETLSFANLLKAYRVPFRIINTPRNLNVSCGISVQFPISARSIAEDILKNKHFNTFAGIFNA